MEKRPRVGVIVVNYSVDPDVLRAAVDSALQPDVLEIVIVDNASPVNRLEAKRRVLELSGHNDRSVRWIDQARNAGFAGGVNVGLHELDRRCELVYLCNPDAIVDPNAIGLCVDALIAAPNDVVSVAPKMLLVLPDDRSDARFIDSVGNAVNAKGEAFNVGIGQPDLGQYDQPRRVFGACFGAVLVRRHAFDSTVVGPLRDELFLYYEDVDWNWRAQLLGFECLAVPAAMVSHSMSVTMRDRPYDEKFALTERNLLICALTYLSAGSALQVAGRRILGLARGSLTGRHYPRAGVRALIGVAFAVPSIVVHRRRIQRRRVRSDSQVTRFAVGERTFYDAVNYRPINTAEAYEVARHRLANVAPTPEE